MSVAGNGVQSRPVVENCARLIYGFVIYLVYKPMNTLNLKTHWQVRWNRLAILTLRWPYKGSVWGGFPVGWKPTELYNETVPQKHHSLPKNNKT